MTYGHEQFSARKRRPHRPATSPPAGDSDKPRLKGARRVSPHSVPASRIRPWFRPACRLRSHAGRQGRRWGFYLRRIASFALL